MSMETTKRVWQARLDPRRNTPSIGIYSHVRDRWGIFHAQPFVLNERQAGVAIEGVDPSRAAGDQSTGGGHPRLHRLRDGAGPIYWDLICARG